MSPVLVKIVIAIATVVTFGALGLIIYNQEQHKTQLAQIQSQIVAQQQLVDGIVRSQSQYATSADLAKFASDNNINLKAIQDNLKTLNSSLAAINVIQADSSAQTTTNQASSGTGPANPTPPAPVACVNGVCPNSDPYGFMK